MRLPTSGRVGLLVAGLATTACGPRQPGVVAPVAAPAEVAADLARATAVDEAVQMVFDWRANEGGRRTSGRGVARVAPPARARLDLFLGNGETVLRAALVDDDLRMPPGAPDNLLPPPDLLWGTLGVLRPGPRINLLGGERLDDGSTRLRYGFDDGNELRYRSEGGRVTRVERVERGFVVEEVVLEFEPAERYPLAVTYRNRAEFRELEILRSTLERVTGFAEDIWDPSEEE